MKKKINQKILDSLAGTLLMGVLCLTDAELAKGKSPSSDPVGKGEEILGVLSPFEIALSIIGDQKIDQLKALLETHEMVVGNHRSHKEFHEKNNELMETLEDQIKLLIKIIWDSVESRLPIKNKNHNERSFREKFQVVSCKKEERTGPFAAGMVGFDFIVVSSGPGMSMVGLMKES